MDRFDVQLQFRCVNRPSGNRNVERCHRTIKRMSARSGRPVTEMVAWYNATPNSNGVVPASTVFAQKRRLPLPRSISGTQPELLPQPPDGRKFEVGDPIFVKPANATCTTKWRSATVGAVHPPYQIEVDGVPYHVSHVRRRPEHSAGGFPRSKPASGGEGDWNAILDVSDDSDIEMAHDRAGTEDEAGTTGEGRNTTPLREEDAVRRPRRTIVPPARFKDFVCAGVQRPEAGRFQCHDTVCVCALRAGGRVDVCLND